MKLFAAFLLSLSTAALLANDMMGKVVRVIDGNTIEVAADDNEVYKLMLAEIDCPELGQEFGEPARRFLEKKILNKKVTVAWRGKDRWGNLLAVVMINGHDDPRIDHPSRGAGLDCRKGSQSRPGTAPGTSAATRQGSLENRKPYAPMDFQTAANHAATQISLTDIPSPDTAALRHLFSPHGHKLFQISWSFQNGFLFFNHEDYSR